MGAVFKTDCGPRWQPLRAAVGAEIGLVVAEMTIDGRRVLDLVFPSYGQICSVPVAELQEVAD